jgi:hypothetical protein
MEIRIQVIIDNDERTRRDIAHWDRPSLTSETLGLQLDEARALLQASQEAMAQSWPEAPTPSNSALMLTRFRLTYGRHYRFRTKSAVVPPAVLNLSSAIYCAQ